MTAAPSPSALSPSARAEPPVVRVEDLRILFPSLDGVDTVKAVDGVSFEIRPAETFGIIGESGSGKSTIGRALVGLLDATEGVIELDGRTLASVPRRDRRKVRQAYQIVFQDPHAALNPRMTLMESLTEPLRIRGGVPEDEMRRKVQESLERVGLRAEMLARYPHELSGGQKQRANIARLLPLNPRLIVCDEVVAALDVSIRGEVLNLFADLQRDFGIAYAFIAHDIAVVAQVSDRIAVTYLGRFMEVGPAEAVTERPLHPYTRALLSAIPSLDPDDRGRAWKLQGEIPSPANPPSGCRFRTRCPFARERCAAEEPALRPMANGHETACHFAEELEGAVPA